MIAKELVTDMRRRVEAHRDTSTVGDGYRRAATDRQLLADELTDLMLLAESFREQLEEQRTPEDIRSMLVELLDKLAAWRS